MNNKILNHIKKVTIATAVIILCSANATYAFTNEGNKGVIKSIFSKSAEYRNKNKYSVESLQKDLQKMKSTGKINLKQISKLIDKLPQDENKEVLKEIEEMYTNKIGTVKGKNATKLLENLADTLIDATKSLKDGIGDLGGLLGGTSSALPVKAEVITMDAKTAVEFGGKDKAAKLSAKIYKHVDNKGKPDSDKWVLLIHPFMLEGQTIANSVGPFYYEKGYNIIAPDLRGFGDSEGTVALGCLESMDVYDWLVKLNAEYDVDQVIVHGISLGAATTNYLSGIDGFINNGPKKIKTTIKPIKELNVIGLVEDCGYVDMTEFATKSIVMLFSGLEKDTFDYYSKATNSLKYCDLPMMIIHGTADTTVKPKNAETIKNTVKGEVEVWNVKGGVHAFVIMGMNKDEYKQHVQKFIDKYEK